MHRRTSTFYSNFLRVFHLFPLFSFLSSFKEVYADYKVKFMPKVSLAKWEFTICRAEKFLARHAWIFLVPWTVDGITIARGEPACTHVCTHIGAPLYVSANLIPFLSALWERMDTLRSLVSRKLSPKASLKNTILSIRYEFSFSITYEPTCAPSFLLFCVSHTCPGKAGSL